MFVSSQLICTFHRSYHTTRGNDHLINLHLTIYTLQGDYTVFDRQFVVQTKLFTIKTLFYILVTRKYLSSVNF